MSKPRILIFSLAYLPFIGGAEVAVWELTKRLSAEFEFEIISADINNFWSKYLFPFWAYRQAIHQHQAKNYDSVWSIMANQAGIAGALFKKSHPNIPFLLTLQEGDDLTSLAYRARLLLPRLFGVFKLPNQIQAISHYLANWARKMGATCPITVIPNGVDLGSFQLPAVSDQEKIEKIIITASRLVYKNGVDILIRALAFLPTDVKLQILGDGPEANKLKALSSKLGLASKVSFLGQVKSTEVGGYLARSTIFARPSRSEGLGNSFLEAMAAGLPVIGTPVGGIPDFLKNSETGWLAEVDNSESVAEQIKFILNPANQSTVQKVISNAKKLVSENYNWDKLADQFKNLLCELL